MLSQSMKSWTTKVENMNHELLEIEEMVENDNLIIVVKDNLLERLKENCEELQLQIEELKKSKSNNNYSNVSIEKSKLKIQFRLSRVLYQERPVKFLNELDRYISFMKINSTERIQIVSQALEGIAKDWWHIYESDVCEYDQFKELFKDRFWNSTIKRQTRRKVEFGTFYAGGKLNRVTCATTIFGYANELELAYSEEELTERLADHFEKGIRHAFKGQQLKSKSTLFQILSDYDNDNKRDQNRETNRDENKREVISEEENEKHVQNQNQNQNVNENQQKKSWQTKNLNASQIQNKNKSSKQKSHEEIDIFVIKLEATTLTHKW